jgi:hypothetical protein
MGKAARWFRSLLGGGGGRERGDRERGRGRVAQVPAWRRADRHTGAEQARHGRGRSAGGGPGRAAHQPGARFRRWP